MKIFENEQEVFDAAIAHLRTQGRKSVNGQQCRYFDTETGNSCAIGGILPPEIDRVFLDTSGKFGSTDIAYLLICADPLLEDISNLKEVFKNCQVDFLTGVQKLHDDQGNSINMENLRLDAKDLAHKYKLTFNWD